MSKTTRIFHLKWDNSKLPRLDYDYRMQKREADGVVFANGMVAIDLGIVYESLDDMQRTLKSYGTMELTYQDEKPGQEQPHAQAS